MKKYTIALFLHFLKDLAIPAQFPTLILHFLKDNRAKQRKKGYQIPQT